MNRRSFLKGIVAAAAFVAIPASIVKAAEVLVEPARQWAIDQLYKAWHVYYKEHGTPPGAFRVSAEFFKLYESELPLNWRWCATMDPEFITPNLIFKGAIVYVSGQYVDAKTVRALGPYEIQATAATEWRKNTTIRSAV